MLQIAALVTALEVVLPKPERDVEAITGSDGLIGPAADAAAAAGLSGTQIFSRNDVAPGNIGRCKWGALCSH